LPATEALNLIVAAIVGFARHQADEGSPGR
jgi:hypothetical protein